MRRIVGSGLLLIALALGTLPAQSVAVTPERAGKPAPTSHGAVDEGRARALARQASRSLDHARAVLSGDARGDATMSLVALRRAYPHLDARQRQQADALLARPTDGSADPFGDGYTTDEAPPKCGDHVCVHYVAETQDAPDQTDANVNGYPDFVDQVLARMESVWAYEIGTRGYRAPATDGTRGGDSRLDVYLAQISDAGLYGYCAPEQAVPGERFRADGYCVLDNDYVGFPTPPSASLTVTAAHEFFHMVQFNYDANEDRWLMEATAVWMEERYADAINDNRQYLTAGQMHQPSIPLDTDGFEYYGNWIFFELLTKHYGVDAVRTIWRLCDASKGKTDHYSLQAVRLALAAHHTTFAKFYARFAGANLLPQRFYTEGAAYADDAAPLTDTWTLGRHRRSVSWRHYSLAHLTSTDVGFFPNRRLTGRWVLTLKVDGPATALGAAAEVLVIRRDHRVGLKAVPLNRLGDGRITVSFDARTIRGVGLSLVNASTRYQCWQGRPWSCQGIPDPARTFRFKAFISR